MTTSLNKIMTEIARRTAGFLPKM